VLLISSILAGFATAPFAAAHFNRYADYGLIANLAAAPVMGLGVMPAAVIAAVLAPFGAAAPALWAMEQGTAWILWVAYRVTDWPGAVTLLPNPGPHVLPLLTAGGLLLVLLRGWPRLAGALPVLAALAFWTGSGRPPVLIAGDGGLVGVMGPQGRALSADRGGGFIARVWLENDGDRAAQAEAAARPGLDAGRSFSIGAARGVHLRGKGAETRVAQACETAQLVVLDREAAAVPDGCLVIDARLLARTGPLALWPVGDGWQARAATPDRPRRWSPLPQGAGARETIALPALNAALMALTARQPISKTAAAGGAPGQ
jgi:competence protein ComEC